MSQIKVLAYFNKKKCQFSLEAFEGEDKGRVIAYEREIILKDCKFSTNKDKTAGVIGFWDSTSNSDIHIDREISRYFGTEEKDEDWSPIYATENIKYDIDSEQYVVEDDADYWNLDPEEQSKIKNDEKFKKPALDNAGLICLEINSDDFDETNNSNQYESESPTDLRDIFDSDTIKGVACYWRKKSGTK